MCVCVCGRGGAGFFPLKGTAEGNERQGESD